MLTNPLMILLLAVSALTVLAAPKRRKIYPLAALAVIAAILSKKQEVAATPADVKTIISAFYTDLPDF